jgi:hypothetical protein
MNASLDQCSRQPSSPRASRGKSSAIWVTCLRIAFHFRSSTSETSIHVVTLSSGTSIFAAWASHSAISSRVAFSGGSQKLGFPSSRIRSRVA